MQNKFRFIVGAALVVVLLVLSVISVNYVKNTVAAEDIFLPITIGEGEPLVLARASSRNLVPGDVLTVNCSGTSLSGEQSSPLTVIIRCNGGATPPPTATSVIAPTATLVPPTATVVTGPTPLPTNTTMPAMVSSWHAPGNVDAANAHSHFDPPQQWVTDWSMQNFGHGVEYGGDENSGPMEHSMKIQAYKGVQATSDAGGQVYFRYHAGSNPLDRSARYHSYELYYKDVAGNISFWQGWYDTGDPAPGTGPNSARCPRRTPPIACENTRPIILVTDATAIAQGIKSEQWYMRTSPQSGVSWDAGITIVGSTTVYQPNENATAADQSTWVPTGDKGMRVRSDGFWYLGRGGGGTQVVGWFCAEPLGRITSGGSKNCATGSLPQYIAPTLGQDARPDGFGNNRIGWLFERTMVTPQGVTITLPN